MGLFGSRKKTTVGTGVSRVIEDASLPDSIKTGTLMAIQQSDGQMIEHSMEELSNGLGIRVDRLYNYAKTHYTHGMPSGTSMHNLMGKTTIINAIQAQTGQTIGLNYYEVGPLNLLHLGWQLLVANHGYDSRTNTLTYEGKTVYLTDMQPVVVEATVAEIEDGSLDMWGVSPAAGVTPLRPVAGVLDYDRDRPVYVTDPAAAADYLLVKYCYEEAYTKVVEGVNVPSKRVVQGQFTMAITGWDMSASYHQAGYSINDKKGFWSYRIGSNLDSTVEAIFDTEASTNGSFFPMIYFRYNKQQITSTDPAHASSKRMLKHINMDFDEVSNAINENPDIADVEQAFMTFAIPADSTDPVDLHYLFDFFDNLYEGQELEGQADKGDYTLEMDGVFSKPKLMRTIVIQDKRFKMALKWDSISRKRVTGKVGEIGDYASDTTSKDGTKKAVTLGGMTLQVPTSLPGHRFRRQISDNVYEEITVLGLKMTYWVWGDYTTTGDENNEDILLIPLDYAITRHYPIAERERLYARSLHYVYNSRVVTKLKWYQTGIFKVFLIIVAVVVTIMTSGLTWEGIVAAFSSAAAFQAAVIALTVYLAKYALITLVIRKVVSILGAKLAFIIAIVAAAYGMYGVATEGVKHAPWAANLLQVSTNLTGAMGRELKEEFKELEGQYRTFQEYAKAQQERLDVVNRSLDGITHLVPLAIWGETPSDFYQRTVHSGNIGVVGIEAVSSYVDAALTLPKLTDSLGDVYV